MKYYIYLGMMLMLASPTMAQTNAPFYLWSATMKVVDEDGNPVRGASAGIGYYTNSHSTMAQGLTDANGSFAFSHSVPSSLADVSLEAGKTGYYSTWMRRELGPKYDPAQWIFTQTIVLKKIGNPIPMYARKAQIEIPVLDKPAGFDLVQYDWVSPFGKGKQSDIVFEAHRRWGNRRDFDASLKITFPNSGDGLLVATDSLAEGSSGPRLRKTVESGNYLSVIERTLSNLPSIGWKGNSTNQDYYLRVRTSKDQTGNVTSALYGKIHGDFTLDPMNSKTTLIVFTYYLNPTPNDKNMEFNPGENLFGKLPILQQVKDP